MLLPLSDIPGVGWRQVAQTSWRIGMVAGPAEFLEIGRRALHTGGFNALRRFAQDDPQRGFFTQVAPFASSQDADDALTLMGISNLDSMRWPGVWSGWRIERSLTSTFPELITRRYLNMRRHGTGVADTNDLFGEGWPTLRSLSLELPRSQGGPGTSW